MNGHPSKSTTIAARVARWGAAVDAVRRDADDLAELIASLDEAAGFAVARPELRDLVAVLRAAADSIAEAVDRAEVLTVPPRRKRGGR